MNLRMSRGLAAVMIFYLTVCVFALCAGLCTPTELRISSGTLLPLLAAILLHEAGHIVAARLCGVRLRGLRLDLFGARLGLVGTMSYRRELAVAAAGPLVNVVSAAVMISACAAGTGTVSAYLASGERGGVFALCSLSLAAVNLLPVRSLDGGRILYCALAPTCGQRVADTVLILGTALCLGSLWVFSVYALLRVGEMLSLFAFSLCLLFRMMGE